MSENYNEFSGTELDQDAEFDTDFSWEDEGEGDIIPILGLSAALAAVVGAILVLAGRRRKKTPMDHVEDFLGDTGKAGKKAAKNVSRAVSDLNLGDLLSQAMDRAGEASADLDLPGFASDVKKRARKLTKDAGLASMLDDALDRAREAGKRLDLDDRTKDVRKTVADAVSSMPTPDVDTKGIEGFLEALKEKLGGAIDSVRTDIAPKAAERLREDVIPAAQGAVASVAQTVKDDVVPAVGDAVQKVGDTGIGERVSKFVSDTDLGKKARQAASGAGGGAKNLSDLARGLAATVVHRVIEEVLPEVKKASGKAMSTAREDVVPAAGQFASIAADKVGDVAQQAPSVLGSLLGMAREQVMSAIDKAGPVAGDATTYGKHRLSDFATFARHRASDVADGVGGSRDGIGSIASSLGGGVGGAFSSVGRGIGGAASAVGSGVGTGTRAAVDATRYATRETMGILFWLAALGGLILMVFVSDKERQKEIVNGALQFFNEVREMWTDLQGPDYAPENANTETDNREG
jgi:hypothetical protein